MEKKKSLTTKIYISIFILLLISVIILSGFQSTANAETGEGKQARGVFTQISLSIGSGNGYVCAKAKNDFTLGYSEVKVYLELYSSADYQTDINNMRLESTNSIDDLNIYKSIETTAATNGETRYWQAQVLYNVDNKGWKSKKTDIYHVRGDGSLMNLNY